MCVREKKRESSREMDRERETDGEREMGGAVQKIGALGFSDQRSTDGTPQSSPSDTGHFLLPPRGTARVCVCVVTLHTHTHFQALAGGRRISQLPC